MFRYSTCATLRSSPVEFFVKIVYDENYDKFSSLFTQCHAYNYSSVSIYAQCYTEYIKAIHASLPVILFTAAIWLTILAGITI